jgi:hypothetical protein
VLLVEKRKIADFVGLAKERQLFAGTRHDDNFGRDEGQVRFDAEPVERRAEKAKGLVQVELDPADSP